MRITSALVGFLLLSTACSGNTAGDSSDSNETVSAEVSSKMRTLTKQQASERADKHIHQAVSALPVEPSLRLHDDSATECQDPTDGGPRGRYEVGKTFWLDELSPERNTEFVDALYKHWSENGYSVLSDKRSSNDKYVWVENPNDSFRMSVQQSKNGDLSLTATSPCVWPDGAPPSETDQ